MKPFLHWIESQNGFPEAVPEGQVFITDRGDKTSPKRGWFRFKGRRDRDSHGDPVIETVPQVTERGVVVKICEWCGHARLSYNRRRQCCEKRI